ncbi:hypothetical protein BGX31_003575 [Mortierella sp. GBA43]|nr:hypothetical protein BGX31_003575 [Mortierella sp. GBA43]
MSRGDSFISFMDLTTESRFLWLSPSVYDVLGFEPEELLGVPAYDILNPEDVADTKEFQKEYVMNDLIASQIILRLKTKNGPPRLGTCNAKRTLQR